MVQITGRASTELRRLLTRPLCSTAARRATAVERGRQPGHDYRWPHSSDSIIRRDNLAVLIVEARLGARLSERLLDFPAGPGNGGGFTLRWRTPPSTPSPSI
jgi:hypothetical protein